MVKVHPDFLFNELKVICKIANDTEIWKSDDYYLVDLVDELLKLHGIARRGGLLDLEEAVVKLSRGSNFSKHVLSFLTDLFGFIIDGTDGDLVRRFGILRYISETSRESFSVMDKLAYIIIIYAVEYIQDGYNPRLAESMLKVLLPTR